jgi:hypothetical protein
MTGKRVGAPRRDSAALPYALPISTALTVKFFLILFLSRKSMTAFTGKV